MPTALHSDETPSDAALVQRLVRAQFPELADLPVTATRSTGTVNTVYRLGNHLYARLPRVAHWAVDLRREQRWLPRLAPHLTLAIPEPVHAGRPTEEFPLPWAIYRWRNGEPYADELIHD